MQGNRQNGKRRGWRGAQFRALQQHGVGLRSPGFQISSLSNWNPLQNFKKGRYKEKKCFVATKHKKDYLLRILQDRNDRCCR